MCTMCTMSIVNKIVDQVQKLKYLGSIIAADGRSDAIKIFALAKQSFNNKRSSLKIWLDKELNIKFLALKLFSSETWTLKKIDAYMLEAFEMWTWRHMEKDIMDG